MSQPFGNISSDQIRDSDIVTEAELGAVRLSNPITDKFPQTLDSTDNANKTLTDNSYDFEGFSIQPGNIVHITSGDAQGVYVVASVDSSDQLTLETAPPNATSGDYTIYHQAGAKIVGVDNSTWVEITGSTLQAALDSADTQIDNNIDAAEHRNLDQLVHNLANSSFTEFNRRSDGFITSIVAWQSSSKNTKLREIQYTWDQRQLSQAELIEYENGSEVERLTRSYTYDGLGNVQSSSDTLTTA